MSQAPNLLKASLGEGNLIFCCMGSRENYFESVCKIVIIIILSFRVGTSKNENIHYRGKETCAMFGLLIQNKNSALNVFLPFVFDFFCHNISIFNKIILLQH